MRHESPEFLAIQFEEALVQIYRGRLFDLKLRHLVAFLICYLNDSRHTIDELSAILRASKSGIARTVSHLEKAGLIRRGVDTNDRRMVNLYRTEAGLALLSECKQIVVESVHNAAVRTRPRGPR